MNSEQHDELRDIHKRIDALKDEGERQFKDVTEKLHNLEVAIAKGNRFPASAWGAVATILVAILTAGAVNYSELQTTKQITLSNRDQISKHTDASSATQHLAFLLDERTKNLESRIVGTGPNGWHRQDHENYAKAVEAELHRLDEKINYVAERINDRANPSRK